MLSSFFRKKQMPSIRKIRNTHHSRVFISKRFTLSDGTHFGPMRCGLSYGDIRSHQRRPHGVVEQGIRALNELPIDTLHAKIKQWKKQEAIFRKQEKDARRALKQDKRR